MPVYARRSLRPDKSQKTKNPAQIKHLPALIWLDLADYIPVLSAQVNWQGSLIRFYLREAPLREPPVCMIIYYFPSPSTAIFISSRAAGLWVLSQLRYFFTASM